MVRVVVETKDASTATLTAFVNGVSELDLVASIDNGRFSHLSESEVARHKSNGNIIDCASWEEAEAVVDLYNRVRASGGGIHLMMALEAVRNPGEYGPNLVENMQRRDPSWLWPSNQ